MNNINFNEASQIKFKEIKYSFKFKLIAAAVIGGIMLLIKFFFLPEIEVPCLVDRVHEALNSLNQAVNTNNSLGDFFIISSSMFIDFFTLVTVIYWFFKGTSMRLAVAIIAFYLIRLPHLWIYTPRFPEGFYYPYPGFPSLTVPYGRQSDFFFSGHCGILTIFAMENFNLRLMKLFFINLFAIVYVAFVLLTLRVHYIIDITSGIVFAAFIYQNVEKYLDKIDGKAMELQQKCGIQIKTSSQSQVLNDSNFDEENH